MDVSAATAVATAATATPAANTAATTATTTTAAAATVSPYYGDYWHDYGVSACCRSKRCLPVRARVCGVTTSDTHHCKEARLLPVPTISAPEWHVPRVHPLATVMYPPAVCTAHWSYYLSESVSVGEVFRPQGPPPLHHHWAADASYLGGHPMRHESRAVMIRSATHACMDEHASGTMVCHTTVAMRAERHARVRHGGALEHHTTEIAHLESPRFAVGAAKQTMVAYESGGIGWPPDDLERAAAVDHDISR